MKPAFAIGPALALTTALAGSACVTRTVYVVDDRDDAPLPAAPRATASAEPAPRYEDDAGISRVEDFYEPLSPYGRWVHTPLYGMVFIPSAAVVGAGFRPYTHGHWVQTEWGWTWVDHHPFGWATGHYGRWYYDTSYGWVWVPGTAWAPAWVSWRTGGGYVGWAPMPPGAAFGGVYTVYETSWVFVSYSSMGVGYVGSALVVGPAYRTCYVSTSPYRETYVVYGRTYYRGPREDDVVRAGGHVVHRPIRDVDNERAVTRPPEGTARGRDDDGGRRPGRGSRDDQRDDDARGNPRGRDDDERSDGDDDGRGHPRDRGEPDRGEPNRGHGNDPDRSDDDNPGRGRGEPGRPDQRDPSDGRGGRDDHGRPASIVDERGGIVNDATPRMDPAAGAVRDRGDVGVGVTGPDGVGVGRDERAPVGGDRGNPVRPDAPAVRYPWRDDERPQDRDEEDPEKFKPINDPYGTVVRPLDGPPVGPRAGERDLGTPARPLEPRTDVRPEARPDVRLDPRARPERGPVVDRPSFEPPAVERPSSDPRGPVAPSRPSSLERTPRPSDRPAVGGTRPAPQPEAQPAAEQQPQGKGKKGKATKKADPKKADPKKK